MVIRHAIPIVAAGVVLAAILWPTGTPQAGGRRRLQPPVDSPQAPAPIVPEAMPSAIPETAIEEQDRASIATDLGDFDPRVRAAAVAAAGRRQAVSGADFYPELRKAAFDDPDPIVRMYAVHVLPAENTAVSDRLPRDLMKVLENEVVPEVRQAVVERLGSLAAPESREALWAIAASPQMEPSLRAHAVGLIDAQGDAVEDVVARLEKLRGAGPHPWVDQAITSRIRDLREPMSESAMVPVPED